MDDQAIAKHLRVNPADIAAWARGERFPSDRKAEQLAGVLRIPLGYLFLSEPPEPEVTVPDRRTISGTSRSTSPNFIETVNACLLKQTWYRERLASADAQPLPFVGSQGPSDSISLVAKNIGETLQIEQLRQEAGSWTDFMAALVRQSESVGVIVLQSGIVGNATRRKLEVAEFRGFALSDPLAPMIFINTNDSVGAQIFTLFHELAHIWIGQSAISNANPESDPTEISSDIERFCDRVAVETLVPAARFAPLWEEKGGEVGQIASAFRVSNIVIIRRAYELGKVNHAKFLRLLEQDRNAQRRPRKPGGSTYPSIRKRHSATLVREVITALGEKKLLHQDAAALLALRVPGLLAFTKWAAPTEG